MPAQPFVGQIMPVGFNFAPRGWALCNGQLLPIAQNQALFSLLGTTYGGNGQSTFALPDLQARIPIHQGQGPGLSYRNLGQQGGTDSVTLTAANLPSHTHTAVGAAQLGTSPSPSDNGWAQVRGRTYAASADTDMAPDALSPVGGGQPHSNTPPYTVLNFVIALQGIFPPRN